MLDTFYVNERMAKSVMCAQKREMNEKDWIIRSSVVEFVTDSLSSSIPGNKYYNRRRPYT